MRGDVERTEDLFSYVPLTDRVTSDHPPRLIRAFVDPILRELSPRFDAIYAKTETYSVSGSQITFIDNVDQEEVVGVISGNTISVTVVEEGEPTVSLLFQK